MLFCGVKEEYVEFRYGGNGAVVARRLRSPLATALDDLRSTDLLQSSSYLGALGDYSIPRQLALDLGRNRSLIGRFDLQIDREVAAKLNQDGLAGITPRLIRTLVVSMNRARAAALGTQIRAEDVPLAQEMVVGLGLDDLLRTSQLNRELLGMWAREDAGNRLDIQQDQLPTIYFGCLLVLWWRLLVIAWALSIEVDGEPAVGDLSVADHVSVEFTDFMSPAGSADFQRFLEPALSLATDMLEAGAFEHDELLESIVTRDRNYLREECINNPDQLNAAIMVPVLRRLIWAVTPSLPPDDDRSRAQVVVAGLPSDAIMSSDEAISIADTIADILIIKDAVLQGRSRYRWLAENLGWTAGVTASVDQIIGQLGFTGPWAIVVAAYVGILSAAFVNSRQGGPPRGGP